MQQPTKTPDLAKPVYVILTGPRPTSPLTFAPQQSVPAPVVSSVGPSLAVFNRRLYMAWKGSDGDQRIWWSNFDGNHWAAQQSVPAPVATSVKPSLAVFNGRLDMAWKGSDGDERIWWSSAV
jgi:hypothetical protein